MDGWKCTRGFKTRGYGWNIVEYDIFLRFDKFLNLQRGFLLGFLRRRGRWPSLGSCVTRWCCVAQGSSSSAGDHGVNGCNVLVVVVTVVMEPYYQASNRFDLQEYSKIVCYSNKSLCKYKCPFSSCPSRVLTWLPEKSFQVEVGKNISSGSWDDL